MECVSSTIEPEVLPEFVGDSTCTTAFFRVATSIDQLDGKGKIISYVVCSSFYNILKWSLGFSTVYFSGL